MAPVAPLSAPPADASMAPARPISASPADDQAAARSEPDDAEPARPAAAPPAEPTPAATTEPEAVSTPAQPVSTPAQPVSTPAQPVDAPAQPVSGPPADVSEQPAAPMPDAPSSAAGLDSLDPANRPVSAPPGTDTAGEAAAPVREAAAPTDAAPAASPPSAAPISGPPADAADQSTRPVPAPPAAAPTAEAATGPAAAPQGDPEQVLAAYRWRLDPETLREVVDDADELRALRRRLTEKLGASLDNRARARLLSLRAVVSRVVHDLDDALADGRLALTYAEATGELRRTALARARLAEVLRWKGEFAEADRLFAEANSAELPDRLRAALHEHAGRSCYDQGRLMEACEHFERALDLRRADDPELTERIRVCLDAVHARAATRGGFGPYPRSREEVLRGRRSPVPTFDGGLDRWGYADADGELVLDYRYAEAQPFREGLAWVRRPDAPGWELIDEAGTTLIGPSYAAVRAFSDGLAWVSRGGEADWMAIDAEDTVVVPGGFEDVRPFTGGVAAVRREGWGAVDRNGRLVVPTRYHGFRTALADGRRLDGFTDEGLAVVELGGFRGVVDRTGRMLVAPAHPELVIHPVAFLANDRTGRWGALDRRGEPLIDPVHPGWDAVLAEIDLLLTDAHPVL
ncbi:WG repeat-containing protein [Micromonospora sp. URMC 105]|uniref:WG repeat-containing protein n=1 Tax=Micromonospora sp. URMC 105 TaxID=3423413 RepID=UPI003F1D7089